MSHSLTEVATFSAATVVPDPGEQVTAASVAVFSQTLANRTQFLAAGGLTGSYLRALPFMPFFNYTAWGLTSNFALVSLAGNTGAGVDNAWIPLHVPHGATLSTVRITLKGAAGHGALPATQFSFALVAVDNSTGVGSTIGSQTDNSGSVGAYEAIHTTTMSPSVVIDNEATAGNSYYIALINESGANSIDAGLTVYGHAIVWTGGAA